MELEELHFREKIEYVCFQCGRKFAGANLPTNSISTVHQGRCDICEQNAVVVSKRHYNYVRALTFKEWINGKNKEIEKEEDT